MCPVLSTQDLTGDRARKVKVSYRECCAGETHRYEPPTVIEVKVQRLALLVPATKMELQKGSAEKDPGSEGNDRTEEGAPDEVLRDVPLTTPLEET